MRTIRLISASLLVTSSNLGSFSWNPKASKGIDSQSLVGFWMEQLSWIKVIVGRTQRCTHMQALLNSELALWRGLEGNSKQITWRRTS